MTKARHSLSRCCLEAQTDVGCGHHRDIYKYTAISRKVVGKKYDQYTVPDTVAVEPTFVASL